MPDHRKNPDEPRRQVDEERQGVENNERLERVPGHEPYQRDYSEYDDNAPAESESDAPRRSAARPSRPRAHAAVLGGSADIAVKVPADGRTKRASALCRQLRQSAVGEDAIARSRRSAMTVQTPSTTPKGHVPARNP